MYLIASVSFLIHLLYRETIASGCCVRIAQQFENREIFVININILCILQSPLLRTPKNCRLDPRSIAIILSIPIWRNPSLFSFFPAQKKKKDGRELEGLAHLGV
jgi:hypothetical protein